MSPRTRPAALTLVAATTVLLALGGPAAVAAGGSAALPGTPPPPNPASGLAVVSDGEAGYQTLHTTVDPLIQDDTTVEPSIAVNPADPLNAVAGYQMGRDDAGGDISNGFATTVDGGRTWTVGTVPGLTSFDPVSPASPYKRASDAVVAFGGTDATTGKALVYYSTLSFDPTGTNTRSAILDSTSHDGGLTWDLPTVVQDDQGGGLNDKNWVVVDNGTGAGHHPGRVYVLWDRVAGVFAKYSDDQGRTWNPPSPVFGASVYGAQGIGVIPVVTPAGDLAVAFMADVAPVPTSSGVTAGDIAEAVTNISHVVVAVAPKAGAVPTGAPLAFTPPSTVATFRGSKVRGQRAAGLVSAAQDPVTGRFYVTTEDSSTYRTDGNNDVVVFTSDDVTAAAPTWSAPVRVNGGPAADQVDHYDPAVAVGPGSTVRVMWRQRQENASTSPLTFDHLVSTWVAQSDDGGRTFRPALRVDRGINDNRFGAFSRGGLFQGDYDQVVTGPDGVSWIVHCEALAVGETGAAVPTTPTATTVHHQRTWVTRVAAPTLVTAPPALPELPSPALAVPAAGVLVGLLLLRTRRRPARRA